MGKQCLPRNSSCLILDSLTLYSGLKQLDIEDWIQIDKTYLQKYNLKKKLFDNNKDQVVQILEGVDDAAFEGLYLLVDVLPRRYPTMFQKIDQNVIKNLVTGDVWNIAIDASTWEKYHPLQIMSLLVTEDFFIMQTDAEGKSSLRAGVVCFPGM
jgi:dimethylamine monooxygenase subunit A